MGSGRREFTKGKWCLTDLPVVCVEEISFVVAERGVAGVSLNSLVKPLTLSPTAWSEAVGPTLFNTISKVLGSVSECPISELADDAKPGREAEALEDCVALPRELERLVIRSERNLLKLNRRRQKVLHLGRNRAGPQDVLGAASFTEPDLVVLVENELPARQQCALAAEEAKILQGGLGRAFSAGHGR